MSSSMLLIRSDPPEKQTLPRNPIPPVLVLGETSISVADLAVPSWSYQRFAHSNLRSRSPQSAMPSQEYHPVVAGIPPQPGSSFGYSTIGCKDCVTECRQPVFPAVELTAQCTDQCVVVACHDITHGEIPCFGIGADEHSNLECDGVTDCTDCTGYEDLLQCCTDYHSYSSQPRSSTESIGLSLPWDSLDSFLCGCTELNLAENADGIFDAVNTTTQSHSDGMEPIRSSPRSAGVSSHLSPAMSSSGPFLPSLFVSNDGSREAIPSHPKTATTSCMWGDCHEPFSSISELAAHVNYHHLCFPPPSLPHCPSAAESSQIQPQPDENSLNDLSCHWADCNLYPSQSSVPGPSSGNQRDDALSILAHHLLQDHLGFLANLPLPDFPDKPAADASDGPRVAESIIPPISPSPSDEIQTTVQHQCSGTHICHWENCDRGFNSCDELTAHITSLHVGAGKAHYVCLWKDCHRHGDRGFSSKQKICRHMQSHTGHRPFQCEECKQYFSEAATLQQHMRRHTQEKPYVCDFPGCGKAFAITGALTIHKRKHNGHKPFKCKYCDRAFAESSNLSKHLRTHTGDRPYRCVVKDCSKSFARPDQLTRHMGVHRRKSNIADQHEG